MENKYPDQKHTDMNKLKKGLKYMVFCLLLIVLGPYLITLSFINDTALFILIPGLIAAAGAIFMGFKGIRTIMSAVFDGVPAQHERTEQ